MNIECGDVYEIMDKEIIPNRGITARLAWRGLPAGCQALDLLGLGGQVCNLMGGSIPSFGFYKEQVDQGCRNFMGKCQSTFCSRGSEKNTIEVPCSTIKDLVANILTMPEVKKELEDTAGISIDTREDLCRVLNSLAQGDINNVVGLVKAVMGNALPSAYQGLADKYEDQLPTIVRCICPDVEKIEDKEDDDTGDDGDDESAPDGGEGNRVNTNVYNMRVVKMVALIISGIMAVPLLIVLFVTKPAWRKILAAISILILTAVIIFIVVMINPRCMFKPCIQSSDDWVELSGLYQGEIDEFGVKIAAQIQFEGGRDAEIISLTCTGNPCPVDNLVGTCPDRSVKIGETPEDQGFPLSGPCVDHVKSFKNKQGDSTIQGLWVARQGDSIFAQAFLHVCLGGFCLFRNVKIPLQKK